jgi:hypothetical protein
VDPGFRAGKEAYALNPDSITRFSALLLLINILFVHLIYCAMLAIYLSLLFDFLLDIVSIIGFSCFRV